ncbi:MAG: M23 family metallopeptidase [Myxococcota bacterium]
MALIALALAQDYSFPTSAEDYGAWYPTAYKDAGGTTDWACGDLTYTGHGGSDFGGGSWDGMDAGRDVTAAAPGTVTATNDGEYDRCDSGECDGGSGFGNYVAIAHADGKTTYYAHLKAWSVAVAAGDVVACGQKIGEMGSSGHSTGPHLHFEVRVDGASSDPFYGDCVEPPTYWVDQGAYGGLPGLVCDDVAPCTVVGRLGCGETLSATNADAGATTGHWAYGCGEYSYSGPEIAWEIATDRDETISLSATGLAADLDLFVLGSEACDGSDPVGCSVEPDASDEVVSFAATAGVRYVVVLDGFEGATSAFSLTASCAGAWPGSGDTGSPPADTGSPPPASEDPPPSVDLPGERVRMDELGGCATGAGEAVSVGVAAGIFASAFRRRRRRVSDSPACSPSS